MTDGFISTPPAGDPPAEDQSRLAAKDAFIETLKEELAGMREALAAKDIEVEAQRLLREAREAANPPTSQEAKPAAREPASPPNEDALVERVIKAQEERIARERATTNGRAVAERLMELYGSEEAVNKIVADRAAELGVGIQFLQDAAAKSPNAFYDLMKLETAPKQSPAPRGEINPAALQNHAPGVKEGTNAYYEQMRRQIGDVAYYKPKIQQQRFKDAQRLGEAFFT
jgi:hypothetical protein